MWDCPNFGVWIGLIVKKNLKTLRSIKEAELKINNVKKGCLIVEA